MSLFTMPPLHPLLVNFTAALIPVSVISDALGAWLKRDSLKTVGWWAICYAAAITPLTVGAGWWWYLHMGEGESSMMELHQWLGTSLAVVLIATAFWRYRSYRVGRSPGAAYAVLAALLLASVVVQGHVGAVLSFGSDTETQATTSDTSTTPTTERSSDESTADKGPIVHDQPYVEPQPLTPTTQTADTAPASQPAQ